MDGRPAGDRYKPGDPQEGDNTGSCIACPRRKTNEVRTKMCIRDRLCIASRDEIKVRNNYLDLPAMTMVVLLSTTEEVEDRQVSTHQRA